MLSRLEGVLAVEASQSYREMLVLGGGCLWLVSRFIRHPHKLLLRVYIRVYGFGPCFLLKLLL